MEPSSAIDGLLFELLTPAGRADPYPLYTKIREIGTVGRVSFGPYVVCGFEECASVLRDPRIGKGVDIEDTSGLISDKTMEYFKESESAKNNMVLADPPEHTALRKLVAYWFMHRQVESFRPTLQKLVDGLVDELADKGEVDFISDFAVQMPISIIGQLYGISVRELTDLTPLMRLANQGMEPFINEAQIQETIDATVVLHDYWLEVVKDRRRHPREDDMLTSMVQTEDGLDDEAICTTAGLLFASGFTSMANVFGNGMLALLHHPHQMEDWRNHPEIAQSAVEELLRFDGPMQYNFRCALEDADLCGEPLVKGDRILVMQNAGNHDPARFTDPDALDLRRKNNATLSLGGGVYYCIGAALGKMEAAVAFNTLLARFKTIEIISEPEWQISFMVRGLNDLQLSVK